MLGKALKMSFYECFCPALAWICFAMVRWTTFAWVLYVYLLHQGRHSKNALHLYTVIYPDIDICILLFKFDKEPGRLA